MICTFPSWDACLLGKVQRFDSTMKMIAIYHDKQVHKILLSIHPMLFLLVSRGFSKAIEETAK
jgi:hypothetical protein